MTKAAIRPSEATKGEAKPKEKRDVAENKEVKAAAIRTLTGRVRGPQGEPLAGIQVTVNPGMQAPNAEPEQFDSAMTDREGVFILSRSSSPPTSDQPAPVGLPIPDGKRARG